MSIGAPWPIKRKTLRGKGASVIYLAMTARLLACSR